jgi:ABC-type phosphate transport system substrate-binding protein
VLGFIYIREHQQTMKLRNKRVSVLALAATAAMAVAGAGAGSAQAANCTGSNIHGEGSSLQRAAQVIWTTGVRPVGFNGNTNGGCVPAPPTADYTTTSSGRFMNGKWGADGVTAFDPSVQFGGTDDAPTTGQIAALNTNLRASVLSIPVAQAAIAIIVNPPSGCSVTTITAANLESVFRGTTPRWSSIGTGANCDSVPITRVVRNDSSGTSYQLKHFLNSQHSATDICTGRTLAWSDLQTSANNQVWPSVCDAYPSTSTNLKYSQLGGNSGRNDGNGGGDEAKTVRATNGGIGYVALSDARAIYTGTDQYHWVTVNAGRGAIDPSTTAPRVAGNSNCTTTTGAYGTLPSATATWSAVYLSNPGTGYPICTLTWDLASNNYAGRSDWTFGGRSVTGTNVGLTVRDYLGYVVNTNGGQADALATANDYKVLPSDVQSAAATFVRSVR